MVTYQGPWTGGRLGSPNNMNADTLQTSIAASRPAAGIDGVLHYATDTGEVSQDNGSTWDSLGYFKANEDPYVKVWVSVASGGTIESPDLNVDSITDTGTGDSTIVFGTDFATAVYAVAIAVDHAQTNNHCPSSDVNTRAVGSVAVQTYSGLGFITPIDAQYMVVICGQQ